jgi:hypothetical protein
MAMTAVRNGSCSVTIGAELGLLVEEVDDDDDDDDAVEPAWALAPVPEAVEEAESYHKSAERVQRKSAGDTYCRILKL